MKVRIEHLTKGMVLKAKDVYMENADGTATLIRSWRGLLPMVSAQLMPIDLIVLIPDTFHEPEVTVRAALEYLGFDVDGCTRRVRLPTTWLDCRGKVVIH